MLDRIQALLSEIREMNDNIAHDLRSPITRIRGIAEVTFKNLSRKSIGISVQSLTPEIARQLSVEGETGVVVTRVEPGSPAADAGVRTGDIIVEVDRHPVKGTADFDREMQQAKSNAGILLLLRRGNSSLFAAVTAR